VVKAGEVGVGVGVGDGTGVGVDAVVGIWVGVGVVVGASHWQPVTATIKDSRQMPTVHIVTFRMMIHFLSTRVLDWKIRKGAGHCSGTCKSTCTIRLAINDDSC